MSSLLMYFLQHNMTEVYPDLLLVYRDKTAGSDVRYVNNQPEVTSGMSKEPEKSTGMSPNLRCFP
jgi:hypothetical protein